MSKWHPEDPHHRGWSFAVRTWAIAAAILGTTYVLVFVPGIEPSQWAAEITFIAAHLVCAEIVMTIHRPK